MATNVIASWPPECWPTRTLHARANYTNYNLACNSFSTQTLHKRRVMLCRNFALKNLKSQNSMFENATSNMTTRQGKKAVREFKCNRTRFYKSSLPYLARLINGYQWTKIPSDWCNLWTMWLSLADGFDFLNIS